MPFGGNTLVHLVPEKAGPDGTAACRLVRDLDLELTARTEFVDVCREPRLPPGGVIAPGPAGIDLFAPEELTTANCRVAIETDYQFFQKFGAVPAATTYVTQMMAAISNQYFTDTQTTLSIAYLGIYSNAADPWTSQDGGGDANALLNEFRNAWVPNNWPVAANLAHFVSGASLGGGVAYLNVLCNQSFGFGVSGNIAGNINWGAWTGQPGNLTWDFVVVAHEIGHNFGAGHTHSYCPPIDRCYSGSCTGSTQCSRGTLMSYCHLCGGMANLDLEFGPIISNIMRDAVNASCLGRSSLAGGNYVQYRVRFSPVGATGARSANLQFSHDAPNATQPFRIVLQGTATP
jgi:hypothetical protein